MHFGRFKEIIARDEREYECPCYACEEDKTSRRGEKAEHRA